MRLQQFAQKAFIWDGTQLLLVRKSAEDPHNPGRWEVPGGRMEYGEDVNAHLAREVHEETGLEVEAGPPFYIWQWTMSDIRPGSDDEIQVIAVARTCIPLSSATSRAGWDETDFLQDTRWVTLDQLDQLELIPSLRPAMETFIRSITS